MLNQDNDNIGYLCGRLYYVLESCDGISEGYMVEEASTRPVHGFPSLINRSQRALAKNKSKDKLVTEIIGKIDATTAFPENLSMLDQGQFWFGYFAQRTDLGKE
jgi:CRISPR-associated protein Csd1